MLTNDQVLSVYSGKDGRCCCGCAGKHYYTSAKRDKAGEKRGYKVSDDEINDRMISKVVKIINEFNEVEKHEGKISSYESVVIGKRLYIAYLDVA